MFIAGVMEQIWAAQSKAYAETYDRALAMAPEALFSAVSTMPMEFVDQGANRTSSNLLTTAACSHRIKGRKLGGCSMCDYHSMNIEGWAMARALRRKDAELYATAVRRSLTMVRGESPKPNFCEQVTGNDCLDPVEFPEPVLDAMFGDDGVFGEEKPFCYQFEVLATNVTRPRLAALGKRFRDQRRLFFDFGVEATEWIREHWINKPCTDLQLREAIDIIHEPGYFAVSDMLIGIPGLTEEQSIDVFLKTISLVEQLGIDRITCLPLNRKEVTLQGFLYRQLGGNPRLTELGLAQGPHTGVPWLFTVLEALCGINDIDPRIYKKLTLTATKPGYVVGECTTAYNVDVECWCNDRIVSELEDYRKRRNPDGLLRARAELQDHSCYHAYRELVERQRHAGDLAATLRTLSQESAPILFPIDHERRLANFECELAGLHATRGAA